MMEYKQEKYFLISELNKSENNLSNDLNIVIYDEINNNFDKLEDKDMFKYIKDMFDKRLAHQRIENNILEQITLEKLVEVTIEKIDHYEYKLLYNDQVIDKNIAFLTKTRPKTGDKLYLSKDTLKEDLLTFGRIKNTDYINNSNILIIRRGSEKIYLERYYG